MMMTALLCSSRGSSSIHSSAVQPKGQRGSEGVSGVSRDRRATPPADMVSRRCRVELVVGVYDHTVRFSVLSGNQ